MKLLRFLQGTVQVSLTSGDIENTLRTAADTGILMENIKLADALTAYFIVTQRDYRRLINMPGIEKNQIKILKIAGFPGKLTRLFRRPILLTGSLGILAFFLFIPTRTLFMEVEGRTTVPEKIIKSVAEEKGLCFGIRRKSIRNETVKNALLAELPQLSWAGVNTRGCRAIITVKEKNSGKVEAKEVTGRDILAAYDGVIESCTTLRGTPLCHPGDVVSKDQILISGLEDHGNVLKACFPEGEIIGKTRHDLMAIIPGQMQYRNSEIKKIRQWGIRIGKKYIKFPQNSGISNAACGRMYEEYCVILPGDYSLPISLVADTYTVSQMKKNSVSETDAVKILENVTESYLTGLMLGGSILKTDVSVTSGNGVFSLLGEYHCREELGRIWQEKIGEAYVKKH